MNSTSRTILIIDDSPEDRELYRRYLLKNQDFSYTILEASLGRQGLEQWHQHQPDAVLLDYRLPDLDGLEFLSQLQSPLSHPCLPFIMVTGQGNEAIAVQAMKAGAQDYLVKGQITPEGLHLAVNGAIETVQLRTQLQQRIERERVVAEITRQIHQSLDLDRILETTVTEVRQFLNTDRVLVFQLQPDGNGTVVAESVGFAWRSLLSSTISDPCLAENYLRFSRPESITHDPEFVEDYVKRYRQGQVTAIPDIYAGDIDPCHIELLAQFQVNANLVVPILHDDLFWGLLIAHHCAAPRQWQSLEIDLLKELATQLGIALRQAQLYQQSQTELAERKRVEAELRESEERLRSALNASRMGTWDWNIQTNHIQWSDNLEAMFGLESGAFDGSFEMFASCLHPDDRDHVMAAVERAIATGEDYSVEFRVVYPDGTIRWALSQGKAFYDQNGQPMRMTGNDMDITERKQAEEALQASEEQFRQLAENIDAVFWLREAFEARVSYVSPAFERLWGLNPQDLYENLQTWFDRIHPDDRESSSRAFQEKAAAGQFDQEYRIILMDGSVRWVRDRCFPLYNEAGQIYRFVGIAEDITDRKRSEQALRESEERFRTSVENMLDCFAIYQAIRNEQGEIVDFRTEYVNDAACLNNQMTREQQLGRGLCELLPGHRESGLFDEYCQVVETGQSLVKDSLVYEDDYGQQRLIRAFDIRIAKLGDGYIATWRDITERKQIEEALRQNEQLLRLALESAQAGSWDWEIATGRIVWSPENYALYGITPTGDSPKYEDWYDALHPDHRESTNAEVLRMIEERMPEFRAEFRIVHPQRGVRWLLGLGRLTLNEQGEPIRFSGINLDITDRKQAEAELLESERQLRLAKDAAALGIHDYDIISGEIRWDARVRELWGVGADEPITYEVFVSGLHPEDRAATQAAVDQALDPTGDGKYHAEYRVIHRTDGMTRWIAATGVVVFEHERAVRLVGTVQDITARKLVEQEAQAGKQILDALMDYVPEGITIADAPDVTIRRVSRYGQQLIGRSPDVIAGIPVEEHTEKWGLFYPDGITPARNEVLPLTRAVQQGEVVTNEEWVMQRPDGTKITLLCNAGPIYINGEITGGVIAWRDISDRVQFERDREQILQQEQAARAEAERVNRVKDEFLAILSHELRSPLNPILGWIKLLQTRNFDSAKTAEALATIERNVKIQTQLIDDLLDIAKILRGKLSMEANPVNLVFVIEAAIDTVRAAAVAKSIVLHPVLPQIGQVFGDATRLQQIIWNLLSNAIKFTPNNGRVDIRLEQVGDQAQITVSDTGKGINPDFLPHIFESFRQEDASTTRKFGGLGLGLTIVRSLVEAHGGTISADSQGEGLGSTFALRLPLLDVEPEMSPPRQLLEQELDLTGIRALAVDDDLDARELLTALLIQYGAEVLTVASAADVLANLESFQPDVLVSDVGMPDVDGYTLIQQVRVLPSHKGGQVPAIALTAYAGEIDYQQAMAAGFQRHLTKPIEPEVLIQAIVALIQRAEDIHV